MRTRTKVKKDAATTADKSVFRLTDMIVEEVSAVDRPANKRPFILVKSADGVSTPIAGEVVAGADGSLTVAKAPGLPTTTQPPESQAAPTSPEAPPIPSATNTETAPLGTALRLSPETKADLAARIDEATKQLAKLASAVSGAEEIQGLTEVPQEVVEGVVSIVSALNTGVTKAAVEKGRKQISMARETKIRAAHSALAEIVAELDAVPEVPAQVEAPAATPTAPAAPATKVVDKRDQVIAGLVAVVEKATASITKQAARIDSLERARPTSNAGVVETTPTQVVKQATDEPWPLDMNSRVRDGADADGDFTSR